MLYADRREAGRILAQRMAELPGLEDAAVLALPRGGVPVAFEIARALRLPLDVVVVRKLGAPRQQELAMGAVASGGAVVLNHDVIEHLRISEETVGTEIGRELAEVARREQLYREGRVGIAIEGRTAILVDDGLATGASMAAAARAVRGRASRVVIAAPVAAEEAAHAMEREADLVVCPSVVRWLGAVGSFYRDFTQTTDDEVKSLLAEAAAMRSGG
jgi:putative phosphoribosyl transferase